MVAKYGRYEASNFSALHLLAYSNFHVLKIDNERTFVRKVQPNRFHFNIDINQLMDKIFKFIFVRPMVDHHHCGPDTTHG